MSINFGKYDQRVEILNYTQTQKVANIIIDVDVRATGLTLNETMRMTWRGKTFNITSIDEFGSRLNEGYKIRGTAKDND